jgi:hypothetical protein
MYYIIITNSVYADKTIKDGAKLLYGLILSLSQKDGYCYASNSYLADTLNVQMRTVQVYLTDLKQKKLIHADYVSNNIRRITTQDTRVKLTPTSKTPLEAKKRASRNVCPEPDWLDDYIKDLVKMD